MKHFKYIIALIVFLAVACKEDNSQQAELQKTSVKKEALLKAVSDNWKFNAPPASQKVQQRIAGWNEWRQFRTELAEKPTGTIGAYRQKVKNLVNKAEQLRQNIPPFFDKPQVRSRIGVLITKMKSLYTYMGIEAIPVEKVSSIINDINKETVSLQNQLDEIIRISEIPKEIGEDEMLRALDTVRMADPDKMPQPATEPANPSGRRMQPESNNRMRQ